MSSSNFFHVFHGTRAGVPKRDTFDDLEDAIEFAQTCWPADDYVTIEDDWGMEYDTDGKKVGMR